MSFFGITEKEIEMNENSRQPLQVVEIELKYKWCQDIMIYL